MFLVRSCMWVGFLNEKWLFKVLHILEHFHTLFTCKWIVVHLQTNIFQGCLTPEKFNQTWVCFKVIADLFGSLASSSSLEFYWFHFALLQIHSALVNFTREEVLWGAETHARHGEYFLFGVLLVYLVLTTSNHCRWNGTCWESVTNVWKTLFLWRKCMSDLWCLEDFKQRQILVACLLSCLVDQCLCTRQSSLIWW